MRKLLQAVVMAYRGDADAMTYEGWRLTRVDGGANGIVYHAESEVENQRDLAVKITQPDGRFRSEREYSTTLALRLAGQDVCPQPVYQRDDIPGLPGSVVISEWLMGERLEVPPPPEDRKMWIAILSAFGEIHSLTPERSRVHLRPAFFATSSLRDLSIRIQERLDKLPDGVIGGLRREQLEHLLQTAHAQLPERWETAPAERLTLEDVNPKNMILNQGLIRFVDWEYAGWADAAFDIAGLCTQPAYFDLPAEHRDWMKTEHSLILDDKSLPYRATIYEQWMLVFWVMRMSQALSAALNPRFKSAGQFSHEYLASYQMRYWERVVPLFGL